MNLPPSSFLAVFELLIFAGIIILFVNKPHCLHQLLPRPIISLKMGRSRVEDSAYEAQVEINDHLSKGRGDEGTMERVNENVLLAIAQGEAAGNECD